MPEVTLQLIDFGRSVDLELLPPGTLLQVGRHWAGQAARRLCFFLPAERSTCAGQAASVSLLAVQRTSLLAWLLLFATDPTACQQPLMHLPARPQGDSGTDAFRCVEMREGAPWLHQASACCRRRAAAAAAAPPRHLLSEPWRKGSITRQETSLCPGQTATSRGPVHFTHALYSVKCCRRMRTARRARCIACCLGTTWRWTGCRTRRVRHSRAALVWEEGSWEEGLGRRLCSRRWGRTVV